MSKETKATSEQFIKISLDSIDSKFKINFIQALSLVRFADCLSPIERETFFIIMVKGRIRRNERESSKFKLAALFSNSESIINKTKTK
jgi:hypothetical protein